jgi:hypothetical protein
LAQDGHLTETGARSASEGTENVRQYPAVDLAALCCDSDSAAAGFAQSVDSTAFRAVLLVHNLAIYAAGSVWIFKSLAAKA